MDLQGKVALVTGAQQGIGRATAIELARAGADIVVNWHDDEAQGLSTADRVRALGRRALPVQADVSSVISLSKMYDEIVREFGTIDVLVNNAGIFPREDFLDLSEETWDQVIAINLKGACFCSQFAARIMHESGRAGSIINMTSMSVRGSPRGVHYSASKGGLLSLTRAMALDLAPRNIRVNAIAPGVVDTAQPRYGFNEEQISAMARTIPLGRIGQPKEVADAAVFLASDRSTYMTGAVIHINGGAYMA